MRFFKIFKTADFEIFDIPVETLSPFLSSDTVEMHNKRAAFLLPTILF